jgi:hypothetical protein
MYSCNSTVKIEKRLAPFIDLNGKVIIEIENVSTGQAIIYLPMKSGVSPEMLEAVGTIALQADFSNASSGQFVDGPNSGSDSRHKPALPHVENDYDEIRGRVSSDLGTPVSSLFIGDARIAPTPMTVKMASTTPVERRAPQVQTQKAPTPVPQLPVVEQPIRQQIEAPTPVAVESEAPKAKVDPQVEIMQQQMAAMMKQMVSMQELLVSKEAKGEVVVPAERKVVKKKVETIMNSEEFYAALDAIKAEMPKFDVNRRLSREESQELERYRLTKPAYVVSNCGQLFINDVGITVRQSTAANLAGIAVYKLKQSGDLKMCFDTGKLKFVTMELATQMAEAADIHAAVEGVESGLKAFVGYDGKGIAQADRYDTDVSGTIDDSPVTSEDIARRHNGGGRRQSASIEEVDENMPDEQSSLMDLTGGQDDPYDREGTSDAAKASARSAAQARAAIRHKSISRLDD